VNRRHEQTLARIFTQPAPANLRWSEIEGLFQAIGAEISEGSGSRIRVALDGVRAVFHRPHPSPDAKREAVRSVREFLTAAGISPSME